jgi:hypothetical protein
MSDALLGKTSLNLPSAWLLIPEAGTVDPKAPISSNKLLKCLIPELYICDALTRLCYATILVVASGKQSGTYVNSESSLSACRSVVREDPKLI